ncbi:hypothetical protein EXIGLDRAFT_694956 [Exidia glandulosa HHB12029]|uniref:Uncharacterized protein n=1 Tax=Exidia glandulosa HHB12029 TaxID=1314781 RepID=A0A165G8G3_EXIGL|nr:hypothetical protein EXIGLDRAFT_694956 [Exidia glandulosa HHB12029]
MLAAAIIAVLSWSLHATAYLETILIGDPRWQLSGLTPVVQDYQNCSYLQILMLYPNATASLSFNGSSIVLRGGGNTVGALAMATLSSNDLTGSTYSASQVSTQRTYHDGDSCMDYAAFSSLDAAEEHTIALQNIHDKDNPTYDPEVHGEQGLFLLAALSIEHPDDIPARDDGKRSLSTQAIITISTITASVTIAVIVLAAVIVKRRKQRQNGPRMYESELISPCQRPPSGYDEPRPPHRSRTEKIALILAEDKGRARSEPRPSSPENCEPSVDVATDESKRF